MGVRKLVKKKTLFLIFILFIFILQIRFKTAYSDNPILETSQFLLIFPNGSSVSFVGEYAFRMNVSTGTFNGTNSLLKIYSGRGSLKLNAVDSCVLFGYAPNDVFQWLTVRVQNCEIIRLETYYRIIISPMQNVVISWRLEEMPVSFVDYTMFAFGMGGIALLIFAPVYFVKQFNRGLTEDTIERFGMGFLMFILGVGMVIAWLWS